MPRRSPLPSPWLLGAWLVASSFPLPLGAAAWAAPTLPSGFVIESASPGALFDTPTGIAFMPGNRMLVAQKEGTVWVVENGTKLPTPLLNIKNEVLNQADRGMLDVAVDPNFNTNRYIYVLYTVDPDSNGVDDNDDAFGRLARYQMTTTTSNVLDLSSRAILFGRTWTEGPPSGSITHTIGSLRWGTDGSLIVSSGEGAQFDYADAGGHDSGMFGPGKNDPLEDIGAFRAQYLGSLGGKILRLNPATGQGYTNNPFYNGNPGSVQSRIWAYGLRNPFRVCVRPGSGATDPAVGDPGSLYLGDVGWSTWEEFSIATQGGRNFGWPCYEGLHDSPTYPFMNPPRGSCATIPNPSPHTPPVSDWNHADPNGSSPSGVIGNAASGSAFYSGTSYPATYQGRYFFADYGQSWIRTAQMDASDNVISFGSFGTTMEAPVDIVPDPVSGDLCYVSITKGQVRRLRYVGTPNTSPNAVIGANPTSGTVPFTVSFTSTGSSDPNGDPLYWIWDFGDGSGSFLQNPSHLYINSGVFTASLTVGDGHGGYNTKMVQITVADAGGFPSTPILDNFNRANGALGSPWQEAPTTSVQIESNRVKATCSCQAAPTLAGGANYFAADQEAYYTFATTPAASEMHINLKEQYASKNASHIEILYDAAGAHVGTFDDTGIGWVARGGPIAATFAAGDVFGARVFGSNVNVYKNGTLLATRSIAGWAYIQNSGYIGFSMVNGGTTRIDNFGGGNYVPVINTPPTAIIAAPVNNSFYVEQQSVALSGDASDAQQTASQMGYHWDVTLHHNNHIHPGYFISDNRNDSFVPEDHEDGTGVWLEAKLVVTDGGGLKDTTSTTVWPEVDLDPSAVTVTPDPAHPSEVNNFDFTLRNYGRMLSRRSHWQLVADTTTLAEGDTLVGPLDSLAMSVPVNVPLAMGTYPLRVVADTGDVVHETNEANNARMRSLQVIEGAVGVEPGAGPLSLSAAIPNPTNGATRLWLSLPRAARVGFSVHDVMGRQVWSSPSREFGAGRWSLEWRAGRVPTGVYLMRVQVGETTWVRRVAVIR